MKKINLIEKFLEKINFPKKTEEYIKIRKSDYELMKKMVERQDNFAIQIMNQTKEIENQNEKIEMLKSEKRKLIGKMGGTQKGLNNFRKKNKILINEIEKLKKIIKDKDNKILFNNKEIEMLKNKGKRKKNIESYKNYFEARKELEKREIND